MACGTDKTYEQLNLGMFLEQTSGVSEHLARTSALQDRESGLKEIEVHSLDKYLDLSMKSLKKCDPDGLSMRMLRECFLATEDLTISQFSVKWTDLGMTANGRISTQNGLFHRTGSESILLDILEPEVDQKCFLSKEQMEKTVFTEYNR